MQGMGRQSGAVACAAGGSRCPQVHYGMGRQRGEVACAAEGSMNLATAPHGPPHCMHQLARPRVSLHSPGSALRHSWSGLASTRRLRRPPRPSTHHRLRRGPRRGSIRRMQEGSSHRRHSSPVSSPTRPRPRRVLLVSYHSHLRGLPRVQPRRPLPPRHGSFLSAGCTSWAFIWRFWRFWRFCSSKLPRQWSSTRSPAQAPRAPAGRRVVGVAARRRLQQLWRPVFYPWIISRKHLPCRVQYA